MFSFKEIVKKLKLILSDQLESKRVLNKDVANALNINYNTFKQMIHQNRIPYEEILVFCAKRHISINWLFFDQLPESLINNTDKYILLKLHTDIGSAGYGIENYSLEPIPFVIDKIALDILNSNYKYTELIRTLGDSMEPTIPDGSLVFIDTSKTTISSNKIYVIKINNELFIKKIITQNDSYKIQSINDNYQDIKVKDFKVIGKVTGVLYKI